MGKWTAVFQTVCRHNIELCSRGAQKYYWLFDERFEMLLVTAASSADRYSTTVGTCYMCLEVRRLGRVFYLRYVLLFFHILFPAQFAEEGFAYHQHHQQYQPSKKPQIRC